MFCPTEGHAKMDILFTYAPYGDFYRMHPLCVLENGDVSECYTRTHVF